MAHIPSHFMNLDVRCGFWRSWFKGGFLKNSLVPKDVRNINYVFSGQLNPLSPLTTPIRGIHIRGIGWLNRCTGLL